MKTPSFGNTSGHDDQYAIYKASERREKDMTALPKSKRFQNSDISNVGKFN